MQCQDTWFFYLRDSNRNPVGAVAVDVVPADIYGMEVFSFMRENFASPDNPDLFKKEPPVWRGYTARLAVSMCHSNDRFDKRIARECAVGRLGRFNACVAYTSSDDVKGLTPPKVDVREMLRLLEFPVRAEIDFPAADGTLRHLLQVAYSRAAENNPNPPLSPQRK